MKLFGFSIDKYFNLDHEDGKSWIINKYSGEYGISCYVVIADSIEDAISIIKSKLEKHHPDFDIEKDEEFNIFEIPFEKGVHEVDHYFE